MKGGRNEGEEGRKGFFFVGFFCGSYRLLNLPDKELCFRGGALEAG